MEKEIKCMCVFDKEDIIEICDTSGIVEILTDNGVLINDIIMTIWFNENGVPIFQLDYYIVKYLPIFISDYDVSVSVIDVIYNRLLDYVDWYELTFDNKSDIELNDDSYYLICKSMCNEIKEQWL